MNSSSEKDYLNVLYLYNDGKPHKNDQVVLFSGSIDDGTQVCDKS